jgi:hypothetical protein
MNVAIPKPFCLALRCAALRCLNTKTDLKHKPEIGFEFGVHFHCTLQLFHCFGVALSLSRCTQNKCRAIKTTDRIESKQNSTTPHQSTNTQPIQIGLRCNNQTKPNPPQNQALTNHSVRIAVKRQIWLCAVQRPLRFAGA